MGRVIILLLDSLGIGESSDAADYGDEGADTLGHIAEYCFQNASQQKFKNGRLNLPNLTRYGLVHASVASRGKPLMGFELHEVQGMYGYALECSTGKDTTSGHWELMGLPVLHPWRYFPKKSPAFPEELVSQFCHSSGVKGILGNCHASGTVIIQELGQKHLETGYPIVYTSVDSVFQIAAHEKIFGLERLYHICQSAREILNEWNVGRVIARPFIGEQGQFVRTKNRRDFSMKPFKPTLLDKMVNKGNSVIAIGKVADIFAHQGISESIPAYGNMDLFDKTLQALKKAPDNSLIFTNFSDFDTEYGHRRNVEGYATALETFDARLPELEAILKESDRVVITADHGCDPTYAGSDHTREHIPILVFGPKVETKFIGRRESFADVGQSIAKYLDINPLDYGVSFF